jgi:hypothetical protein
MTCRVCEDKLIEYLYGELSEEDAAAMEQHLEASAECRRAFEDFASVLETVLSVDDEEEPPPALHTRIMGHAQEAGAKRRSFWAWILRPAVTTAVIGAITAGVYFATLRHRPPSFRDERIVLEKSSPAKAEQGRTFAPAGAGTKLDSLEKEAGRDQALLAAQHAKPPAPVEEAGPAPKQGEIPEKKQPWVYGSSRERAKGSLEEEATDQELPSAPAPAARKAKPIPTETYGALPGSADSVGRPEPKGLGFFRATPPSSLQKRASLKEPMPKPIAEALDLASQERCAEAEEQVGAYAAEHPGEAACGTGWLEAARCYLKKNDPGAARKAAEKALKMPGSEKEARAFLESLPGAMGEAVPPP